jgi:hypothetical protein
MEVVPVGNTVKIVLPGHMGYLPMQGCLSQFDALLLMPEPFRPAHMEYCRQELRAQLFALSHLGWGLILN